MEPRFGRREVAGWLALGAAGVVAALAAGWLFFGGADESQGVPAGSPGAGSPAAVNLGPLEPQSPEVGGRAPDFALLDARDGTTVRKLSDFHGKTVVLNWYASWCGPCRSEMPDFEAAYQALGGEQGNVVFLLVNLMESQSAAAGMLSETRATYPSVLDTTGSVADRYRISGMPTTFFIDSEGVVRSFGRGRITADTLKNELAALGHSY